jgi:hypothetical protein
MVGVVMEVGVIEAHHQPPHQEVGVVIMVVAVVTVVITLGIGHHRRSGIVTNARIQDSLLLQIAKDLSHLQHHLLSILLQARSQANGVMLLDGGRRKARQVATRGLLTQADTAFL